MTMSDLSKLGIIGGSGPEAGINVMQKVLNTHRSNMGELYQCDKDAPYICLMQVPGVGGPHGTWDLDDTSSKEYLQLWDNMTDTILKLQTLGADCFCITCNTLHAMEPAIRRWMQKHVEKMAFISIVEATKQSILNDYTAKRRKAVSEGRFEPSLLSGTVAVLGSFLTTDVDGSSPYHNLTRGVMGLDFFFLNAEKREYLQDIINRTKKCGPLPEIQEEFYRFCVDNLLANEDEEEGEFEVGEKKADYVVLGCTELPLLMTPERQKDLESKNILVLDPNQVLAEALLSYGGYLDTEQNVANRKSQSPQKPKLKTTASSTTMSTAAPASTIGISDCESSDDGTSLASFRHADRETTFGGAVTNYEMSEDGGDGQTNFDGRSSVYDHGNLDDVSSDCGEDHVNHGSSSDAHGSASESDCEKEAHNRVSGSCKTIATGGTIGFGKAKTEEDFPVTSGAWYEEYCDRMASGMSASGALVSLLEHASKHPVSSPDASDVEVQDTVTGDRFSRSDSANDKSSDSPPQDSNEKCRLCAKCMGQLDNSLLLALQQQIAAALPQQVSPGQQGLSRTHSGDDHTPHRTPTNGPMLNQLASSLMEALNSDSACPSPSSNLSRTPSQGKLGDSSALEALEALDLGTPSVTLHSSSAGLIPQSASTVLDSSERSSANDTAVSSENDDGPGFEELPCIPEDAPFVEDEE
jgi:aspartate/glutamate racemase